MSKEDKKVENTQSPLERFSNNNANLKRYLGLALKNTREIMKLLLPKIAVEVRNVIFDCIDVQKNQVQTTRSKKLINEKALIEQMYYLVGYKRREEKNGAFEIVVHRAIKLGKMMVDYPKQFDVDEKNSKIFVMSKVATPFIIKKLEGQKSNTEKLANTDEKLVEVNTGVIDRVHKVKYGGGSKGAKDKNILLDTKFKSISGDMFKLLERAINYSNKKDVRFFDMVDESVWSNLSNIFTLMNSDSYINMKAFAVDYKVSIGGDLEKRTPIKKAS
jgi:hypothetical protein